MPLAATFIIYFFSSLVIIGSALHYLETKLRNKRFNYSTFGYPTIFVLMNAIKVSQREQPFAFELRALFIGAFIIVFALECAQYIRDKKFSGWILWDALIAISSVIFLALGFW